MVGHRRSSWMRSMNKPLVGTCESCGAPRLPHRVCMQCGTYGGKTVIEIANKEEAE